MEQDKLRKRAIWALFIVFVLYLLLVILGNSNLIKQKKYPLKFEEQIREYSTVYQVDPFLVASIIFIESRFNPDAVSMRNAKGLMQILPSTGEWVASKLDIENFNETHLLDPETNIQIGCWYISYLSSQFSGNMELVLAAYNGGIGNVSKWLKEKKYSTDGKQLDYIPFVETRNYVEKVLGVYNIYQEIYPGLEL
ncbi:MAG: lytic transglycosylase domain-containing protein [Clostridiales bacterium]|nr:lytic transglycosylase domain-containing protein [Clostridiales bacterium]